MDGAFDAISRWPLHAVDRSAKDRVDTIEGIEATIRALPRPPALVVVDHLLILSHACPGREEHHRVTHAVRALVEIGKRTGCTLLVLAHIGRATAGKGELYRRPRAEDLAGGRTIEEAADGILILHREDKHPTSKESQNDPTNHGRVEVFAPKLRGVRDCGYGVLLFRGEVQRFEPFDPHGGGDWSADFGEREESE
ncbi:MAG TPA: DnaB-like helicase C-terminal domain-containing protein [Gemmatimonadaceae bacterium]|nr:DnaB-like helicase C-terminal domain-containing protein [Gemmatimonadaceae bacterium]